MAPIYLQKIVPTENQYRWYSLHVTRTIFGQWALIKQWGRIGRSGQRQEAWFEEEDQAAKAAGTWSRKKQGRGYTILDQSC